jgi:hypothetical protein
MTIELGALMMKKMRHCERSTTVKEKNSPGDTQEQAANPTLPCKCNELEI